MGNDRYKCMDVFANSDFQAKKKEEIRLKIENLVKITSSKKYLLREEQKRLSSKISRGNR